jgi:hypothetical protein
MATADDLYPAEALVRARPRTISIKRLPKGVLARDAAAYPPDPAVEAQRPRTRGECERRALGTPANPCPWQRCRWHLALDVNPATGNLKENFPGRDPVELPATCGLVLADRGGMTLEDVATAMNLTRERVRQVEARALAKLKSAGWTITPADLDHDPEPWECGATTARVRRGVGHQARPRPLTPSTVAAAPPAPTPDEGPEEIRAAVARLRAKGQVA